MSDLSTVTLLYTANIRGDLALMPRLAALIQRERRAADGLVLTLDLGDTCQAESWVCRATLGRAPLLVLDAMGYDGALVGGPERAPIPPDSLLRLREQAVMKTLIWGRPAAITKREMTFHLVTDGVEFPETGQAIRVDRSSTQLPQVGAGEVVLGDVPPGMLARVDVDWPGWIVRASQHISLSPDVLPDSPTMAIVELVESEARSLVQHQAQQRGGDGVL